MYPKHRDMENIFFISKMYKEPKVNHQHMLKSSREYKPAFFKCFSQSQIKALLSFEKADKDGYKSALAQIKTMCCQKHTSPNCLPFYLGTILVD